MGWAGIIRKLAWGPKGKGALTVWDWGATQHPLWYKFSRCSESGHRGNLPQHNKDHMKQTHSKHHCSCWKTESISSEIRNKTKMSILTILIQHNFGSPRYRNQRRKRNKRNPNWKKKKKVKMSLFADGIILYIKKHKRCYQKTTRAHQWSW